MMESIEKLRESSHLDDSKWTLETSEVVYVTGNRPSDPNAVNWGEQWRKIADEIEAEIESRYMELPVDADGVPIHVGDKLTNINKPSDEYIVAGVNGEKLFVYGGHAFICASQCRHVKPRTIEDVLEEFYHAVLNHDMDNTRLEQYADELRELMEVGK